MEDDLKPRWMQRLDQMPTTVDYVSCLLVAAALALLGIIIAVSLFAGQR